MNPVDWKDFFGNSLEKGNVVLYTPISGGGLQVGIFYEAEEKSADFARVKIKGFKLGTKFRTDPNTNAWTIDTYPSYSNKIIDSRRGSALHTSDHLELILVENPLYRMDNEKVVDCLQAQELIKEDEARRIAKKKK